MALHGAAGGSLGTKSLLGKGGSVMAGKGLATGIWGPLALAAIGAAVAYGYLRRNGSPVKPDRPKAAPLNPVEWTSWAIDRTFNRR